MLSDCTGSYFPEFHESALTMMAAQGAIVGWVSTSTNLLAALASAGTSEGAPR